MKNLTELMIIIDRSGSMGGLEDDVIGGFNSLIAKQKKEEGKTLVSTVFFNNESKFIHEREDIDNIKPLDGRSYSPSGTTALLDAIGDAISFVKAKHALTKEEDLPEHTIFSIMTDGMENSSREYSYNRVKSMIEMQRKCGWEFIFQAANIDTFKEADRLGIQRDNTMSFSAAPEGILKQTNFMCAKIEGIRRKHTNKK